MKKILLLFAPLFAWFNQGLAQILPFVEMPDSLNSFMDLPGNLNLEIADIDDDGLDDVLLYNDDFSSIHQFRSLGNFEFEEIDLSQSSLQDAIFFSEQYFNDSIENLNFFDDQKIIFADIDSDGDTDLSVSARVHIQDKYSCSFYYDERHFLNFQKNGEVLEFNSLVEETCEEQFREYTDWDEDGDLDKLTTNCDYSCKYPWLTLMLFEETSQTFESGSFVLSLEEENFHAHDVNGDGYEDIITIESSRIKLGPEEFSEPIPSTFPLNFQNSAYRKDFGDFNNDENQEYLVYDDQTGKWRLFSQNCDLVIPGTSCFDGLDCTLDDVWNENCSCVGTPTAGIPCDDGQDCSIDDQYDENCNCIGTVMDADNDGVCDSEDQTNGDCELNDTCDDGDDITIFDQLNENCECVGTPCIGLPCDDGQGCTIDDQFDSDCNCIGTLTGDSDMDGICDGADQTNGDCTLGEPCEDNDECTTNEFIDENCECNIGFVFPDADEDGVCDQFDQCPGLDDNLDADNDGTPDCLETVGLEEILESQVNIFPNPSSGELFIETELKISQVKMYNAIGEEMPIFYTQNKNLDLSYYSSGLYLIELHSERGIIHKKVFKN